MNKNTKFLSSIMILCAFGIADASAAPSVRMLGTNTARVGSNTTVVKSNPSTISTPSTQRLGSVRTKAVSTGTPVSIKKVSAPATTTATTGDESRLSLGKYIHSAGVANGSIKPGVAAAASTDLTVLADRVTNLEGDVTTLTSGKQDKISVGDDLVLTNNNIDLAESISELPDKVTDMQTQITSITENYLAKDDISDMLDQQIGSDINTIYDAETGQRTYITIVDTFNDDILE